MHLNTPDSSGKPAGCAAPEDLERIAGIGPQQNEKENGNELEKEQEERQARVKTKARR